MKIYNMMIEEVVESLNKYIGDKRYNKEDCATVTDHIVLHKLVIPAPTFKAYKVFEYTLWVIHGSTKYKLFTKKLTCKVPSGAEAAATEHFEVEFLIDLLKVVFDTKSKYYENKTVLEDIVYGKYAHNYDE